MINATGSTAWGCALSWLIRDWHVESRGFRPRVDDWLRNVNLVYSICKKKKQNYLFFVITVNWATVAQRQHLKQHCVNKVVQRTCCLPLMRQAQHIWGICQHLKLFSFSSIIKSLLFTPGFWLILSEGEYRETLHHVWPDTMSDWADCGCYPLKRPSEPLFYRLGCETLPQNPALHCFFLKIYFFLSFLHYLPSLPMQP